MGGQIGKYLYPDEMDKFKVVNKIRMEFKNGLQFNGVIESVNVKSKFYFVRYTNNNLEKINILDRIKNIGLRKRMVKIKVTVTNNHKQGNKNVVQMQ